MKRFSLISNFTALLWNTLWVYVAYMLCRLAFVLVNLSTYPDLSLSYAFHLFGAGIIFDTTAIQKAAENQFLLSCVILKSSIDSFWRLQTWEKEGY